MVVSLGGQDVPDQRIGWSTLGIIFISHSSRDNDYAVLVRNHLRNKGWNEFFLDIDSEDGIAAGQKWQHELRIAGDRCSAVVAVISRHWLSSDYCRVETQTAAALGKAIFGLLIDDVQVTELPNWLGGTYQLLRKPDLQVLAAGLRRANLHPTQFAWPPPDEPHRSPYRGLRSLDEADAGIFFGRDHAITNALEAIRGICESGSAHALAILGASGSGKSSFLKAGLLARLSRDTERYLVLPTVRPGREPLTGPTGLLYGLKLASTLSGDALVSHLDGIRRPEVDRLRRYAEARCEAPPSRPPTLVLPIDQAEELFAADGEDSTATLQQLHEVFTCSVKVLVVMAVRTDGFEKFQTAAQFADISFHTLSLGRLSVAAYKEVIEKPGIVSNPNFTVDPALTERLISEYVDDGDALPLLGFALGRMYEFGEGGGLRLNDYETGIGGLEGTIRRAADEALASSHGDSNISSGADLSDLVGRTFIPWLTKIDTLNAPPKRRVATRAEFPPETLTLVDRLVDQRLLVSEGQSSNTAVEVSHEAVLSHWPILVQQINQQRLSLLTLEIVRQESEEWSREGRMGEGLIRSGDRLRTAEELLSRPGYAEKLGALGNEYLGECRTKEHQRLITRRLAQFIVFGLFILLPWYAVLAIRSTSHQASLLATDYARRSVEGGKFERGTRLAAWAAREGLLTVPHETAAPVLMSAVQHSSLIFELRGHQGAINGVALSGSGNLALSWGEDGTARVWSLDTGTEIAETRHTDSIVGAAFSPDENQVLSRGKDGKVRTWETSTGKEITSTDHGDAAPWADYDRTGKVVLSWGGDNVVRVWDPWIGTSLFDHRHQDRILGARFLEGNRFLSWGDRELYVRGFTPGAASFSMTGPSGPTIIDVQMDAQGNRALIRGFKGIAVLDLVAHRLLWEQSFEDAIPNAIFDPSGRQVLAWSIGGAVWVYDAGTGKSIASTRHEGGANGAIFDHRGSRVLSWGRDGTARVWGIASEGEAVTLEHETWVDQAVFSPDGDQVLSWDRSGSARIWDASTGEVTLAFDHEATLGKVLFDRLGKRLLSWETSGKVTLRDASDGTVITSTTHESGVRGATFSPDQKKIVSWDAGGTLRVLNAPTEPGIATIKHEGSLGGAILHADRERILSWDHKGNAVVWTTRSGEVVAKRSGNRRLAGAAFGASSESAFVWDRTGVSIWDLEEDTETPLTPGVTIYGAALDDRAVQLLTWTPDGMVQIWDPKVPGSPRTSLKRDIEARGGSFSKDGRKVLLWDASAVTVWDPRTGRVKDMKSKGGDFWGAAFDQSAEHVISWGRNQPATVWDADSGSVVAQSDHGSVSRAAFSATEATVLSWGTDRTVKVWDGLTGRTIATMEHRGGLGGAVLDRAGKRVFSWGRDGIVWSATTGEEIARLHHEGGISHAHFDTTGHRVVSLGENGSAQVWNVETGLSMASTERDPEPAGMAFVGGRPVPVRVDLIGVNSRGVAFDSTGERLVVWGRNGLARIWDVSWTVPRASNSELVAEVCKAKLAGNETPESGHAGGRLMNSVRRLDMADTRFAPILQEQIGADVCANPSWFVPAWRSFFR